MIGSSSKAGREETRVDRAERWLRNQPLISVLIILGICVVGVSEVAQHGTDLLTRMGILKEKTLQLSTQNAKGELSRKLVALASRRIYWTRNYYTRVELDRPPEELDYSWNRQLDAVADWSSDVITNINTIREYYPHSDKLAQFTNIHDEFMALETDLVSLRNLEEGTRRTHSSDIVGQHKQQIKELIPKIRDSTNQVNYDLYMFALNESMERATNQDRSRERVGNESGSQGSAQPLAGATGSSADWRPIGDNMTLDTVLNVLGLAISLGGVLAARLTKQLLFTIFACSLLVTTGASSWLALQHQREVSRVETQIKARLSHNRWNFDRIRSEMNEPDPKALHEALSRAIEDGTVKYAPTECIVNDGSVLPTRVYFNNDRQ